MQDTPRDRHALAASGTLVGVPSPGSGKRAVRRVRARIETCSLRTAIAGWTARRLVPAVFPKVNPLARALLRSPLHGLMSRHVIVLCFEGRRTGKRYETPVAYRRADDGALEALTSVHGAWWRNLESGAPATVVHRGRTVPARVDVVLSRRLRPARGERRGGQARARLPRPPAPRHDARPARGDRPPACLADQRDRPRRLTPLPPFNCFESPLPRLRERVREGAPAPPRPAPPVAAMTTARCRFAPSPPTLSPWPNFGAGPSRRRASSPDPLGK